MKEIDKCILDILLIRSSYKLSQLFIFELNSTLNDFLILILLLFVLKAGACYLPLDVTFPPSRVAHILNDSKPGVLLTKGAPSALSEFRSSPDKEVDLVDFDDIKVRDDDWLLLSLSQPTTIIKQLRDTKLN